MTERGVDDREEIAAVAFPATARAFAETSGSLAMIGKKMDPSLRWDDRGARG